MRPRGCAPEFTCCQVWFFYNYWGGQQCARSKFVCLVQGIAIASARPILTLIGSTSYFFWHMYCCTRRCHAQLRITVTKVPCIRALYSFVYAYCSQTRALTTVHIDIARSVQTKANSGPLKVDWRADDNQKNENLPLDLNWLLSRPCTWGGVWPGVLVRHDLCLCALNVGEMNSNNRYIVFLQ